VGFLEGFAQSIALNASFFVVDAELGRRGWDCESLPVFLLPNNQLLWCEHSPNRSASASGNSRSVVLIFNMMVVI
jgi:hypothetical protein